MKHITNEDFVAYMRNELNDSNRSQIEDHLDECEICFLSYIESVTRWNTESELSPSFTDNTLDVLQEKSPAASKKYKSQSKQTLVHYALAAGLTILLMGSGVFQYVFSAFDDEKFQDQPSITEQVLDKRNFWLNEKERGE
ncbi:zf-HC2 domain-containing protein [Halobacillus seohaensis]|uniref:Zf-HC2 domain-containing protein n=1 Tax=Halobacillus seohaensis TaxID=447421 RepID=A0ABW2EHW4_9BACI